VHVHVHARPKGAGIASCGEKQNRGNLVPEDYERRVQQL